MEEIKTYVREAAGGALRVGQTRVSLDSVVIAFQNGESAEEIQRMYPALTLEEVYGAITWYLANPQRVHDHLKRQEQRWEEAKARQDRDPPAVVQRLRALRESNVINNP